MTPEQAREALDVAMLHLDQGTRHAIDAALSALIAAEVEQATAGMRALRGEREGSPSHSDSVSTPAFPPSTPANSRSTPGRERP